MQVGLTREDAVTAKSKKYWLGFDLGGTKMMATVFDHAFKIRGSHRTKTKGGDGARGVMERLQQTIMDALAEARIGPRELGGIGVGCPGPLDLDRGIVLQAPNLGWKHMPLKETIEKTFHCPAVIGNDVDLGTYGEYRFGAGRDAHCLVGVFPGTGIGAGCVYEGRLLRGKIGSCMELGHIQVVPDGRLCGCGRRGCLETVASRLAIAADAAMAVFRGEAPHLKDLAGADVAAIKSGVLSKAIKAGDVVIEDIVRHAARQLGVAIGNVVNLLAPDIVVLGGGLVEAMPGLILPEVRQAAEHQAMKSFTRQIKIVAAELGDNAGVLGAAALAAEAVGK